MLLLWYCKLGKWGNFLRSGFMAPSLFSRASCYPNPLALNPTEISDNSNLCTPVFSFPRPFFLTWCEVEALEYFLEKYRQDPLFCHSQVCCLSYKYEMKSSFLLSRNWTASTVCYTEISARILHTNWLGCGAFLTEEEEGLCWRHISK